MSRRFLIIDGYNLLHAAGLARDRYGPDGLERQRERLLGYLSERLTAEERVETKIVFDAFDAPVLGGNHDRPRSYHRGELRVIFAKPGTDADSHIERMLSKHSAPKQVFLISSDHRLQRAAKRRRARFIDSERFFERLQRRGGFEEESVTESAKYSGELSPREVDDWMRQFGDLADLAADAEREIIAEVRRQSEARAAATRPVKKPASRSPATDNSKPRTPPTRRASAPAPTVPSSKPSRRSNPLASTAGTGEVPIDDPADTKPFAELTEEDLREWLAVDEMPEMQEINRLRGNG